MLRKWTAWVTSGIGQDGLPATYSAVVTEKHGPFDNLRYDADVYRVFSDDSKRRLDDVVDFSSERSAKNYARELIPKPDSGRIQWKLEENA